MLCSNCGNNLVHDAEFCNVCGAPVGNVNNNINNSVNNNSYGNGAYSNYGGNMMPSGQPVKQRNTKKTTIITLAVVAVFIVGVALIIVGINSNKLENKILGSWTVDSWWLGTKYEFYEDGVGYYTRPDGAYRTEFTWNISADDKLTIQFKGESYCSEYDYGSLDNETWEFTDLDGDENDVLRIGYRTLYR